jgi:hypothetical protein
VRAGSLMPVRSVDLAPIRSIPLGQIRGGMLQSGKFYAVIFNGVEWVMLSDGSSVSEFRKLRTEDWIG